METTFTPVASLIGGIMIGLSATFLMLFPGRVMGATGILAGLIQPATSTEFKWRLAFLAGMVSGPVAVYLGRGEMPTLQIPVSAPMLILGGLIVGVGVTFGSGCTSGHGVCGMARLSPRSIAATLTFMVFTFATVYVTRHILGV